jgi:hypothetical protein
MAKKNTVSNLSSAALYKLANEREQEEMAKQQEANKEKLTALRQKRRELVAKQKKDMAKLDAEIRKLGGKAPSSSKRKRSTAGNVSAQVVAAIAEAGEINTQDLKAALAQKGIIAGNLGQTLSYLKRQGKISSPSRAVYAVTK